VYQLPVGDGIRVDNGFEHGYPDLLWSNAKLITYGETREEAIQIMLKAIDGYLVKGVETTLPSVNLCLNTFRSGNFDTHCVL
jgi:propionyl-CoA carboxylase alpha chain